MVHDYSHDRPAPPKASLDLDREAEAIKFAFKSANVGYWMWDKATGYIYLTDIALKMLQLPKAEFSNKIGDIKTLIHPDDYETVKKSLNTAIESNKFFEIEFRIRRPDMSYFWMNIGGRPEREADGSARRMGGSVVDASSHVRMKQELQQEKHTLRVIFDNVPARIWFKDSHNTIIRLNQRAADSMSLPVKAVEGADTYVLFPEMAKKYHDDDLAVINSGVPLEGIVEKYTPIDGPHGWVSTDKLPFTDPASGEKYVLVISTDITQQKEYEAKIIENSVRLNQANKDLDHFAHMASHDLKAPLRGMDELTKWIAEDLGDALTPDISRKIDLLRGRVTRMDTLLKDMLSFSRAGKNIAPPERIDMNFIIDEVTGWLPPLGDFKIIKDSDFPVLNVPRSPIEHIFLNLLSNAIKHHDRADGTVNIGYEKTQDHHLFYVADNGPGIPEAYQDHVFEIFRKLKRRDVVEGSGIGLSIVKKMTEALGGKVNVISEDGQRGTTFNIYLPIGEPS